MTNHWFGVTDRGSVRDLNQDAFYAPETLVGRQESAQQEGRYTFPSAASSGVPALWAVSDGMGGHESGEEASTLTLQLLAWDVQSRWQKLYLEGLNPQEFIPQALLEISAKLAELSQGQVRPMGCTLTGVWVPGETQPAWVFHVGDTRLWYVHAAQNELRLLTQDHNWAFGRTDGQGKNILESCLGGGMLNPRIDVFSLDVKSEDVWILVSDGLEDGLDPATFETLVKQNLTQPVLLTKTLLEKALPASSDNITVLTVAWK